MYNPYNYYMNDPMSQFIKLMQESWYNLVVNNAQINEKVTETTYDSICRFVCEVIKPSALQLARQYTENLERGRKQQLQFTESKSSTVAGQEY